MSLKKVKKEELELMSNKEIAVLILKDLKKPATTADLFKKIISLLELPESTFENKIGEFYTQLATDKNFILLDDGKWDLSSNHKSNKTIELDEESEEEDEEDLIDDIEDESEEDSYDDDDESYVEDSTDEDLKDLVIIDEDELELDS